LFSNVYHIDHTNITLPNNITIPINTAGTVKLSDRLILHPVFYVPSFHFNLISVSSLTKTNKKISVHFYHNTCFIQDHTQAWTIGRGDQSNDLYLLNHQSPPDTQHSSASLIHPAASSILPASQHHAASFIHPDASSIHADSQHHTASFVNVSPELWHQRLGHPSMSRVQSLSSNLHIPQKLSEFHCKICHLSKQKRLPFVSNKKIYEEPFSLIHIDVWGPFHITSVKGYRYFLTIVDDCTRMT